MSRVHFGSVRGALGRHIVGLEIRRFLIALAWGAHRPVHLHVGLRAYDLRHLRRAA